jgi:hypothetical protein
MLQKFNPFGHQFNPLGRKIETRTNLPINGVSNQICSLKFNQLFLKSSTITIFALPDRLNKETANHSSLFLQNNISLHVSRYFSSFHALLTI